MCSERDYNDEIFEGRVGMYNIVKFNVFWSFLARFPFDDHQSPLFDSVLEFCVDVHEFLKDGKNNAAVVHCKAGKGRYVTVSIISWRVLNNLCVRDYYVDFVSDTYLWCGGILIWIFWYHEQ